MGAIFGFINRGGASVDLAAVGEMSKALAARGASEFLINLDGGFLGCRSKHTTKEAGDFVNEVDVIYDARLDDRSRLSDELEVGHDAAACSSDGDLLRLAYLKWDEECVAKISGDFAFAVYDRRKRKFFAARDRFGVKPFVYGLKHDRFVFASEPKAILASGFFERRINYSAVADYLIRDFDDTSSTFFEDLKRLPPGHILTVESGKVVVKRYYELDRTVGRSGGDIREHAEELRRLFTKSIRNRMTVDSVTGVALSGGLDSSSIAVVANKVSIEAGRKRIPTFSLVYDRIGECDERNYINAVLDRGDFEPNFLVADEFSPLRSLDEFASQADRPPIGVGQVASLGLYRFAASKGVNMILSGHDGDSAISYGYRFLNELAQKGRWAELFRQSKALGPVFGLATHTLFGGYWKKYWWRPAKRRFPLVAKIAKKAKSLQSGSVDRQTSDEILISSWLTESFRKSVDFEDRTRKAADAKLRQDVDSRTDHFLAITAGGQAYALEENDALSARSGVELRYPFWDSELIEFALSLPGECKLQNGHNRYVMRVAMKDSLPPQVCWRPTKTDFTPAFMDGMMRAMVGLPGVSGLLKGLDGIVDYKALADMTSKVAASQCDAASHFRRLWDLASLGSWMVGNGR